MLWLLYWEFWEEQESKIGKKVDNTKIYKKRQYEVFRTLICYATDI